MKATGWLGVYLFVFCVAPALAVGLAIGLTGCGDALGYSCPDPMVQCGFPDAGADSGTDSGAGGSDNP